MVVKEEINAGSTDERTRALKLAIDKIEKDFGKGAIMRLGDKSTVNVDAIPTGALALDVALGIGGIPRGRIIEIYGPESSGKTTLAQHIVAECQQRGGIAAFVDAEHALDPEYAKNLGVNIDELFNWYADEYANRHTSKVDAREESGAEFVFDEEPINC